jgi:hypothetical protein
MLEVHSLGLKADGTIVAWGSNVSGQCNVPAPNAGFVAVAAGGDLAAGHSLGLKADGTVVAWGVYTQCDIPAPNADFVTIAAGWFQSLGVRRLRVTPVELSAFDAAPVPGGILLTWSTAFERHHLGFRVHRAAGAADDYVQLTALIGPPGPYRFLDTDVRPGTAYFYRLEAVTRSGGSEFYGPVVATAGMPPGSGYALAQSHPNPFLSARNAAEIGFALGDRVQATLRVFDATGRLIRVLAEEPLDAGPHVVWWDGRNEAGREAASGMYFYRLEAGPFTQVRTLVKLR